MDFAQEALHNRMLDICEGKALEASRQHASKLLVGGPDQLYVQAVRNPHCLDGCSDLLGGAQGELRK